MVIYFYSILNQLFFSTYLNHARNRSWNQQVLSNVSKVTTGAFIRTRTYARPITVVRHDTYRATPLLKQ